jgi:phenylalanyl-tRNA synthetase alpha chain
MPPIERDLSIVVAADRSPEEIGDRVRAHVGACASAIESITVIAETAYADLPEAARQRLAIEANQKNVLLRIVLRDLERTLTHTEANELRDSIYAAVHEGSRSEWASHFSSRAAKR